VSTGHAVLLVRCGDRPGIVAATAGLIFELGGNIVAADQHTDAEHGLFVQRIEFDLLTDDPDWDHVGSRIEEVAGRFDMAWILHRPGRPDRVAILASKEGHCVLDLLSRVVLHELDAEVAFVAANHPDLEPEVSQRGVAFHHVPAGDDREAHEAALLELIEGADIDLVVLARYMRILSAGFVERFEHRIINIHHSFLPAFVGARPYHQAHARGVKIIGATAHYATADLDEGPIIAQDVVPVSHRDTVEDLRRRGRDLERVVLARAVRLHLERRILAYANRTVVFD
jgi:formyltetrahydrofolate deformylase